MISLLGKRIHLNKGEVILKLGQTCDFFFYVEKGCFRAYRYIDDNEITLGFSFAGDIDTCPFCYVNNNKSLDVIEALSHSIVYKVYKSDLENYIHHKKQLNNITVKLLADYIEVLLVRLMGALKSNINDLVKYITSQIFINNTTPLGQAYLTCTIPQVTVNGKYYYGFGWEYYYTPSGKIVTAKSGGTGGFTSFIVIEKNIKKALIGLFNNNSESISYVPFFQLVDKLFP